MMVIKISSTKEVAIAYCIQNKLRLLLLIIRLLAGKESICDC